MGLEPVSTIVVLGTIAVGAAVAAVAASIQEENERSDELRRQEQARRRREEKESRKREEASRRQEEARRRHEEASRREEEAIRRQEEVRRRQEEEAERRWEREERRRQEEDRRRRREERRRQEEEEDFYDWAPQYSSWGLNDPFISRFSYSSKDECDCSSCRPTNSYKCDCSSCNPEKEKRQCDCFICWTKKTYSGTKGSVAINFTPPSTTEPGPSSQPPQQDKNEKKNAQQNSKNYGSSSGSKPTGSSATNTNSTSGTRTNTQNSNSRTTGASSSGSQDPQRNGNNKKDDEQNNEDDYDYGRLNDFIKLLKAIFDRYNCSAELRKRILGFFKNFDKHEDNFIRLLGDITIQGIKEEDVLSIVVQLFKSDAFNKDVTYGNFLSLLEFVAKYIKDEAILEMAAEDERGGTELPIEVQTSECIKRVLARTNILTSIKDLFNEIRKKITEDNTAKPLDIDFSGIFTKVYHYFKHRVVRGKVLTVKEYFDWVRKLIPLVKALNPEYTELTNRDHERREIRFEMYVTVFQGYFRIIVRVFGTKVNICTVYVREKRDKNAKDGDKYVDGKKRK